MKRFALIAVLSLLINPMSVVFASELRLYCEGTGQLSGKEGDVSFADDMTVDINIEAAHMKVHWQGGLVIDKPMIIKINSYGAGEFTEDDKVVKSFYINRSTLHYAFMTQTGAGFWSSEGTCEKYSPKI